MPNNLQGQNISDTYQRVVQIEDGVLSDGTGSALPISISGNDVTIAGTLHAVSVSSSRVTSSIVYTSGSSIFGDDNTDTQTFIGNITASGVISASRMTSSFIHLDENDSSIKFGNGTRAIINNGTNLNIYTGGVNLLALGYSFEFNPHGWSSKNFIVNTNTDNTLYIASSKVAIGTDATTAALLTVDGELSASAISTEGSVSASILTAPRISASNHIQTPEIRGVGDTAGLEVNGHLWLSGSTSHYLSASIVSASNLNATNISASYAIFGTPGSGHFTIDPTYGITGYETDSVSNKTFRLVGGSQYGVLQLMGDGTTRISLSAIGAAYFNRNIGFGTTHGSDVGEAIHVTGNIEATGLIKTGHVTASGNISGSYLSMTSGSFNTLIIGSGSAPSNYGDVVLTSISASGDISASGNIIAENIRLPGAGKISFDNSLDGTDQFIIGGDEYITIDGDDYIKLRADEEVRFQDNSGTVFASINPNAGHITSSGNISGSISSTITMQSASFSDLEISSPSGSIVGQRHILWSSPIYINTSTTTTLVADAGYFGSSAGNTRGNWNDPTSDAFDSSAGTFVNQVNIEEDKQNKMFTAPFPISRIEALGSWRPANAGSLDEGYWVGIWTGSAGERLGLGTDANTQNIGFVTGAKGIYANATDWAGNNLDLDYTFSPPLPAHTQIFYGHGTTEASSISQRNTKGHLQLIVYEAR